MSDSIHRLVNGAAIHAVPDLAGFRGSEIPSNVTCQTCLDSNALESEVKVCECGKLEGTFACRIRHIQINSGDAKAARD